MLNVLMERLGFERLEAFLLAAPAILFFFLTGLVFAARTVIELVSQIRRKEIVLRDFATAKSPFDRWVVMPSFASCCILALCGVIMSFFSSCNCVEGQENARECDTVSAYWVEHHATQHWWQMMGDVLWLAIGVGALCLVGYGVYKTVRLCWRYALKRPVMAIVEYARSFTFRL